MVPSCALIVKSKPASPVTSPEAQTRTEISSPTVNEASPLTTSSHRVGSAAGKHAGIGVCVGAATGVRVAVGVGTAVAVDVWVGVIAAITVGVGATDDGVAVGGCEVDCRSASCVGVGITCGSCAEAVGVCTGTSVGVLDESAVAVSPGSNWTGGTFCSGFEAIGVSIAA